MAGLPTTYWAALLNPYIHSAILILADWFKFSKCAKKLLGTEETNGYWLRTSGGGGTDTRTVFSRTGWCCLVGWSRYVYADARHWQIGFGKGKGTPYKAASSPGPKVKVWLVCAVEGCPLCNRNATCWNLITFVSASIARYYFLLCSGGGGFLYVFLSEEGARSQVADLLRTIKDCQHMTVHSVEIDQTPMHIDILPWLMSVGFFTLIALNVNCMYCHFYAQNWSSERYWLLHCLYLLGSYF